MTENSTKISIPDIFCSRLPLQLLIQTRIKSSTATVVTGVGFYFLLLCQVQTLVTHLLFYFGEVSQSKSSILSYLVFFFCSLHVYLWKKNGICFYSGRKVRVQDHIGETTV